MVEANSIIQLRRMTMKKLIQIVLTVMVTGILAGCAGYGPPMGMYGGGGYGFAPGYGGMGGFGGDGDGDGVGD